MKQVRVVNVVLMLLLGSLFSRAQQTVPANASVSVPPVIQFSNAATSEAGSPLAGTVEMTFSLYNNCQGGASLWSETQSVTLDNSGHYSVYVEKSAGDFLVLQQHN